MASVLVVPLYLQRKNFAYFGFSFACISSVLLPLSYELLALDIFVACGALLCLVGLIVKK